MKKGLIRAISVFLALVSLGNGGAILTASAESTTDNIDISCESPAKLEASTAESATCSSENIKVGSRFWELFFGKKKAKRLIASGDVFGIQIKQMHATIVDAPGVPALKCGDSIISINHKEVRSAKEVKEAINSSGGSSVTLVAKRGNETIKLELVPKLENNEYRLGITLKDMTAGIGTITYIDPETGCFGGLGHGICDSENGAIVEIESGNATEVLLGGIHKGEVGSPGELSGIMTEKLLGKIEKNTEVGVFGKLNSIDTLGDTNTYEIADKNEIKAGEATIISTLKNGKKAEYKIEIYDIDKNSSGSKSFKIKVKDPALTAITGGIVRGMSGSPIIQNGKLIGAVTHVLVADPTTGYGIFIENMLNASVGNNQQKAA